MRLAALVRLRSVFRTDLNSKERIMGQPGLSAHSPERLLELAEQLCASAQLEEAERVYRHLLATSNLPRARADFARFLALRERYGEALQLLADLLDDPRTASDAPLLALVHALIAGVYRELGETELARRFQHRALCWQPDFGAADLLNLANDAVAARRLRLAESLIETAFQLSDELEADGDSWGSLGVVHAMRGEAEDACRLFLRAISAHRQAGDYQGMGKDLLNLAEVFGKRGQLQTQRRCLDRACRCFEVAALPWSLRKAQRRRREVDRLLALRQVDASRN